MAEDAAAGQETRAAVEALAYRLRNWAGGDPGALAAEFVAALTGQGWLPPGGAGRQRALYQWAVAHTAGREDWDPVTLLGVMESARLAGVPYEDVARVLWRLAWSEDGHADFGELRDLTRNHRPPRTADRALTREERDEVFALAQERMSAARERFAAQRRTGPHPVLRREDAAPGTGTALQAPPRHQGRGGYGPAGPHHTSGPEPANRK